jgi:hypothetical protein
MPEERQSNDTRVIFSVRIYGFSFINYGALFLMVYAYGVMSAGLQI